MLSKRQLHDEKRNREKRILAGLTTEQQTERKKMIADRVKRTEVRVRAASLAARERKYATNNQ